MKKFNYQITLDAPNPQIADLVAEYIGIGSKGLITSIKREETSPENSSAENKAKENFLSGIFEFEKVLHIIKCCVKDDTLIDRLAKTLGFTNKSNKNKTTMNKFTCDFSIPANTEAEAETKLSALKLLATHLTARELEKIAYVIKNDPIKTSMAKAYLGV